MKTCLNARFLIILSCIFFFVVPDVKTQVSASGVKKTSAEKKLFQVDEVLAITLHGNMRELLNDRMNVPKNFPLILSYQKADMTEVSMSVDVSTRGHFRRLRENCFYPPLLLQFPKGGSHLTSLFKDQKKVKLVMPCRQSEYIIREWLVYKLYNLVTPQSFRARLVNVTLEETKNKKQTAPFYGILLEEEKQMAKRNKMVSVNRTIRPEQLKPNSFLSLAVFQYMIGNTDWSVHYLHNIKLMANDSLATPTAVPYDFDHAGIVNASYAYPAELLRLSSIRQRRYRGYCVEDVKMFVEVIARYNELRKDIYALYQDCTLLDEKYKKNTIKYLDEFFETINNPKAFQREFNYPCFLSGNRNLVIKGLKKE